MTPAHAPSPGEVEQIFARARDNSPGHRAFSEKNEFGIPDNAAISGSSRSIWSQRHWPLGSQPRRFWSACTAYRRASRSLGQQRPKRMALNGADELPTVCRPHVRRLSEGAQAKPSPFARPLPLNPVRRARNHAEPKTREYFPLFVLKSPSASTRIAAPESGA